MKTLLPKAGGFLRPVMLALCGFMALGPGLHGTEPTDPDLRQRLERFRAVEEVMALVEREFVDAVDRHRLWQGALQGMVQQLDRHSSYTDSEQTALNPASISQADRGFGFDWHYDPITGSAVVRRVLPRSQAFSQGLFPGDILLRSAEQRLLGLSAEQVGRILGRAGDRLQLRVRGPDGQERELELHQQPLDDHGLGRALVMRPGMGLIEIHRLLGRSEQAAPATGTREGPQTTSGRAFRQAVDSLQEAGLQALIIDLRGNGGGSIPAAVEIADAFLSGSAERPMVLARQRGRSPARHKDWLARGDNTLPPMPLAVLIDGSTASAAEVLAAALQDHRRAVIIGSPSQGKDSVQQTFRLDSGASLRLTVARFLTPHNKSLAGVGLSPDIQVEHSPLNRYRLAQRRWLEAQGKDLSPELASLSDPQLERALDILTALLVVHRP